MESMTNSHQIFSVTCPAAASMLSSGLSDALLVVLCGVFLLLGKRLSQARADAAYATTKIKVQAVHENGSLETEVDRLRKSLRKDKMPNINTSLSFDVESFFDSPGKCALSFGDFKEVTPLDDSERCSTRDKQCAEELLTAGAERDDLAACWQQLDALGCKAVSPDARSAVAAAVRRSAGPEDVELALTSAETAQDPALAVAALEVGAQWRDANWMEHAAARLTEAGLTLPPEANAQLVRTFGREGSMDKALMVWRTGLAECNRSEPPGPLVGAMLEACLRNGNLETAFDVAREVGWYVPCCFAGQAALLALISGLADCQNLPRALEVYTGAREHGLQIDLHAYNALLGAAVRDADTEQVAGFFRDLLESGVSPDLCTFSTVVRGYCAAGQLERAMMLFAMMRRRGITPSASVFNAILDGCARKQMRALTEQVLADMEDACVLPSNVTLAILVRLYSHCRDIDSAFDVVATLSDRHGLRLNGCTFGALITACLYNNELDRALGVFDEMVREGHAVSQRLYEALIPAFLREGDLECAVRLVDTALGLCPDVRGRLQSSAAQARLEPRVLQDVLHLIGKRRKAYSLGSALVLRLRAANVELSERCEQFAVLLLRDAERGPGPVSYFSDRRAVHATWRRDLFSNNEIKQ